MTAIATLPVLLQTGNHAGRPAASAVGSGALYFCTTHSLIYQQIGGAWGTFWTFSGLSDPMTTRGDIIIRDASNVTARLAIGSSGKVLQSDGTDISWQTPSGGGALVLLEQHTASSSAQLDFTTFISSTYDEYEFHFVRIVPATDSVVLRMRMGTGGGPTYDTGNNYGWAEGFARAGALGQGGAEGGTSAIQLVGVNGLLSNSASWGVNGVVRLYDPQNASQYKMAITDLDWFYGGGNLRIRSFGTGSYEATTALTAIRFYMSSGDIASGTIRAYGVAK